MGAERKPKDLSKYTVQVTEHIRALRLKKGFTIAGFAERVGVGATTVDSWESGEHAPQIEKFPIIARVLSVTPRGLLPVSEGAIIKRKQKAQSAGRLQQKTAGKSTKGTKKNIGNNCLQ